MGSPLPDETIQQVTVRTEGWLVGLQLLALSLQGNANPTTLLEETSGDQRYILDYLTEEVLRRQSQEMQTFLLCTSSSSGSRPLSVMLSWSRLAASRCSISSSRPIYLWCLWIAGESGIAIMPSLPKPYATSWSRRSLIWCPAYTIVPASGMPSTTSPPRPSCTPCVPKSGRGQLI